jgi:hypothetical protein
MRYWARGVVTTTAESAGSIRGLADDTTGVAGAGATLGCGAGGVAGTGEEPAGSVAAVADVAVSIAGFTGRRAEGKSIGVPTSTIAIRTSARRVRLSMQRETVAKELDRSRQAGMDGNAQYDAGQASYHVRRRVVRLLRWRTRNSLDNNGMRPAGAARA